MIDKLEINYDSFAALLVGGFETLNKCIQTFAQECTCTYNKNGDILGQQNEDKTVFFVASRQASFHFDSWHDVKNSKPDFQIVYELMGNVCLFNSFDSITPTVQKYKKIISKVSFQNIWIFVSKIERKICFNYDHF